MRLSAWVAMRCAEKDFQEFLGVCGNDAAAAVVRSMCGIKSRAEIDTNPVAEHLCHQMIRLPYSQFLTEKEKSHV